MSLSIRQIPANPPLRAPRAGGARTGPVARDRRLGARGPRCPRGPSAEAARCGSRPALHRDEPLRRRGARTRLLPPGPRTALALAKARSALCQRRCALSRPLPTRPTADASPLSDRLPPVGHSQDARRLPLRAAGAGNRLRGARPCHTAANERAYGRATTNRGKRSRPLAWWWAFASATPTPITTTQRSRPTRSFRDRRKPTEDGPLFPLDDSLCENAGYTASTSWPLREGEEPIPSVGCPQAPIPSWSARSPTAQSSSAFARATRSVDAEANGSWSADPLHPDDSNRPGHGEEHRLITSLLNPHRFGAETS